jgi:S-adenosylmethionine hydrolase
MEKPRIITLLTDFGLRDHYVGAMKGVILSINPAVSLVDISHGVPPQDLQTGAFTLGQAYRWYPLGTVHLAVVDPGVGTDRRAVAVSAGGHFFVAPDNGLLSYVFEREEEFSVHEITAEHYFCKPVSATFHGRDVFAPIAAWLSRDIPLHQVGPACADPVKLRIPARNRVTDSLIQGAVLAVDQFGNLVTNLTAEDVPAFSGNPRPCRVLAGHREITAFRKTFGEGTPGEVFIVNGSAGLLEIVARGGSAAQLLNLSPGAPIGVILGP